MLKKHRFEVKPDPGQFFFGENFFIRKIPIKCKFKTFFNIFFRCIIRLLETAMHRYGGAIHRQISVSHLGCSLSLLYKQVFQFQNNLSWKKISESLRSRFEAREANLKKNRNDSTMSIILCALNDGSIFSVIIVVLCALSTTTLLTIHMGAGGKKGAIPAYVLNLICKKTIVVVTLKNRHA